MLRGEIWLANFEPVRGSEANKQRPAIIVSSNAANISVTRNGRGVIVVVPLTSNVRRILSFQVLIPAGGTGLAVNSKAQPEQVRALSLERFGTRIGQVPASLMARVDNALRAHLALG